MFYKSRWYHCNMQLKIGHGHEESLNKGTCIAFAANKHADVALDLWKKW